MKEGYNELVGLQATFSKVVPRYSLIHYYGWLDEGKITSIGTIRGYDMYRYDPIIGLMTSLRKAYAPAIISIWQQVTPSCIREYYQLRPEFPPQTMGLSGHWDHWAER